MSHSTAAVMTVNIVKTGLLSVLSAAASVARGRE